MRLLLSFIVAILFYSCSVAQLPKQNRVVIVDTSCSMVDTVKHDTIYLTKHDTTYIRHDTTITKHDTTTIRFDSLINVFIHDTLLKRYDSLIWVHDSFTAFIHDTVTLLKHDTFMVIKHDTLRITITKHDTIKIKVVVHDTLYGTPKTVTWQFSSKKPTTFVTPFKHVLNYEKFYFRKEEIPAFWYDCLKRQSNA